MSYYADKPKILEIAEWLKSTVVNHAWNGDFWLRAIALKEYSDGWTIVPAIYWPHVVHEADPSIKRVIQAVEDTFGIKTNNSYCGETLPYWHDLDAIKLDGFEVYWDSK